MALGRIPHRPRVGDPGLCRIAHRGEGLVAGYGVQHSSRLPHRLPLPQSQCQRQPRQSTGVGLVPVALAVLPFGRAYPMAVRQVVLLVVLLAVLQEEESHRTVDPESLAHTVLVLVDLLVDLVRTEREDLPAVVDRIDQEADRTDLEEVARTGPLEVVDHRAQVVRIGHPAGLAMHQLAGLHMAQVQATHTARERQVERRIVPAEEHSHSGDIARVTEASQALLVQGDIDFRAAGHTPLERQAGYMAGRRQLDAEDIGPGEDIRLAGPG